MIRLLFIKNNDFIKNIDFINMKSVDIKEMKKPVCL